MDATVDLAAQHGPLNVTMSQVAEGAGIGRATLYKYFSSVEEILHAWHERQVNEHLALLGAIAEREAPPAQRLAELLEAYARIRRDRIARHPRGAHEMAALLHGGDRLAPAEQQLRDLVRDLLAAAAADGQVRSDVPADELAAFCLQALGAASELRSDAATRRLARLVVDAVRGAG